LVTNVKGRTQIWGCFAKRVLRTKDEASTKRVMKLHNEELHSLYTSADIIKKIKSQSMRWGHVARIEEMRNAYRILIGEPEGKVPLGRLRH
jgi:hypothetical protein